MKKEYCILLLVPLGLLSIFSIGVITIATGKSSTIWGAILTVITLFCGGVLTFISALELLKIWMLSIGRKWHDIPYPKDSIPPSGLSLVAPWLTDKQGNSHFGAYLVDCDRNNKTAKALWIIKPRCSGSPSVKEETK